MAPEVGWSTVSMRGSRRDPRSPAHRNQYKTKADVWSESALLLYEEAVQRQWSSAADIPWSEVEPLPDDIEMAMCTLCTFLTQVEFIAGDLPGRFMGTIHPEQFETQLFLGTQIMDESRHEDVFRKRALVNGGGLVDAGFGASQLLAADDFTEMTARLHLVPLQLDSRECRQSRHRALIPQPLLPTLREKGSNATTALPSFRAT